VRVPYKPRLGKHCGTCRCESIFDEVDESPHKGKEPEPAIGYHLTKIDRGEFGEPSKIFEEVEEFRDSLMQNNTIMALTELSDVIGAIEGWLGKYHPTVTLGDLLRMKETTARAFASGHRSERMPDNPCGVCGKQAGPYWCPHCKAT
jgi:hypothetical protein